MDNLKKVSGPTIEFLGFVPDSDLPDLFAGAKAFLFASFEDFGVVPVEALAAGTPVIAYAAGGALDYVVPGKNGEFFTKQTADSLTTVLKNFNASKYPTKEIMQSAQKFSPARFRSKIKELVC